MSAITGRGPGAVLETMRVELRGTPRTWRGPVLAGAAALTGVGSPIIAHVMPEVLASTLGEAAAGAIAEPTVGDAWAQWVKNASSLLLIVLVLIAAASVAGERSEGITAAELAGRGARGRGVHVTAKALWLLALTVVATAVSALCCLATTTALFGRSATWGADGAGAAHGALAAGLWGLGALTTLGITLLVSSCSRSTVLPAAVGIILSLLGPTLALWRPVADWTPLGLGAVASDVASAAASAGAAGRAAGTIAATPLVMGAAVPVALAAGAAWALRRAEL
ncbi:hypothetical protein ABXS69_08940 [Actinomyces timonensis]|uniref:ABC-type transport system involved in multi-copper enzyme maturation, permease component n=1 Tax=Actinomyces timonensis TaxID=1288391 RepID=A0AAU8N3W1_9ACTO